MKIVLLQNTILNGSRYVAGDSVEVSAEVAKKMEKANLASIEKPVKTTGTKAEA